VRFFDFAMAHRPWKEGTSALAVFDSPTQPIGVPHIRVVADDVLPVMSKTGLLSELGPVLLPYDSLWIEARTPGSGSWRGASVRSGEGQLTVSTLHAFPDQKHVYVDPQQSIVTLNPDGTISNQRRLISRTFVGDGLPAYCEFLLDEAQYATIMALTTIALMNCRNVTVEPVTPAGPLSKKHAKRFGRPLMRYSRIVLPATRNGGGTAGFGGPKALHLVRGHFKTYTDDAPLFGKRTGTWWWGWQARGDESRGTVIPSYDVRPLAACQIAPVAGAPSHKADACGSRPGRA